MTVHWKNGQPWHKTRHKLRTRWAIPAVLAGAWIAWPASLLATAKAQPASNAAADANPRAEAYYHFTLGHLYEDSATESGNADMATQAVEQYKLAMNYDPKAPFLQNSLADLYFRMGNVRDAINTAQMVLQQHPNNLEAHKLLGRVYLRSLGDGSSQPSPEMLKLAIEQFQTIVQLEPNKIENHLMLGQLYGLNHQMDKAQEQLQAAHSIDPNSEDAVLGLARLYSSQGDWQRVIQVLNSVSPDDRTPKISFVLGSAYDQVHDAKNAIAAYQNTLDNDPDNLDAQRALAQDLLQTGHPRQALKLFEGISAEDPDDVQSDLRVAELEREQGHLNKAQIALAKAEKMEPDSVEVHYNRALLDEAQGHLQSSADGLQKLVTGATHTNGVYTDGEKNNLAIFLDRLASVQREQNKIDDAIATYKKLIALGGDYAMHGYQSEIDAERDMHAWPQALAVAQQAVQAFPESVDMKLALASELVDTNKSEQAIALEKSLLQTAPANADAAKKQKIEDQNRPVLLALVQTYTRLRRWKDAAETLNQAAALSTGPQEQMYIDFLQGALEERQAHYEAAEAAFRKSMAIAPNNPMTLNYLGYMMADHDMHLDEALKLIQHAVQLDPQNGAYLDSLGWANLKLGQYALAEENLEKAMERMPNDPTVHDHMGELYARTGRLRQAVAQWERSLAEYAHAAPGDAEPGEEGQVEKKLENAKVRLSKLSKEDTRGAAPAHR
jgi:tetratricopeptide (TPR) repeat protein